MEASVKAGLSQWTDNQVPEALKRTGSLPPGPTAFSFPNVSLPLCNINGDPVIVGLAVACEVAVPLLKAVLKESGEGDECPVEAVGEVVRAGLGAASAVSDQSALRRRRDLKCMLKTAMHE